MGDYVVSALKYRPLTFGSVVGQGALTSTLRSSVLSGRLAHAYLFSGPRGVGKTTCARILAKSVNCLRPLPSGDACEECESCRAFNEGRSLNIYELDAASHNSVDDIRQLIESVSIPPQLGRWKVYIVDEVHMLSSAAFNAFLKTLEEPPSHAIFILATTEKHKLLPTIVSRCQQYDFAAISLGDIAGRLAEVAASEGIAYEAAALRVIAEKADGGMRDALSLFDQVVSYCGGRVTLEGTLADLGVLSSEYYFRMVEGMLAGDVPLLLLTLGEVLSRGFDGGLFMGGLNAHLRRLLLSKDVRTLGLLDVGEESRARYGDQAGRCGLDWLYRAIRRCTDCDLHYRACSNKRLLVELTLIEMCGDCVGGGPAVGTGTVQSQSSGSVSGRGSTSAAVETGGTPVQAAGGAASPPAAGAGRPQGPPLQGERGAAAAPPATGGNAAPATAAAAPSSSGSASASPGVHTVSVAPGGGGAVFSILQGGYMGSGSVSGSQQPAGPSAGGERWPLTGERLVTAWRELACGLPREMSAEGRRLEHVEVRLSAEGGFEAVADNPSIAGLLGRVKAQAEAFMGQRFGRAMTMRVVQPAVEDRGRMLSRTEQVAAMREENPVLGRLVEELGMRVE